MLLAMSIRSRKSERRGRKEERMEIHINLEFVESIDELKATIDELKDMEYFGTKIFVNVEHLKIDPSAGTDKSTNVINHSCRCHGQEC